jgi:transposase
MPDKAYDADELIQIITQARAEAVIPPRNNRTPPRFYGPHRCKRHNLVERFFCRIKEFRRIATRYDNLAQNFSAFIALVAALVWLK